MKAGFRKFYIWCITVVLLLITCLLPYFSQSVLAVTAGDVEVYLNNAAKVQAVTLAMKRCVSGEVSNPGSHGFLYESSPSLSEYIFDGMGSTNVATGTWLENLVQGKTDDGEIYCKNNNSNIINVFASTLGISWQDVVCDGDNPGIFLPVKKSDSQSHSHDEQKNYAYSGACKTLINDSDFNFAWNEDGAVDYIKKLYDNYKSNNAGGTGEFLPAWNDINNFSDRAVAYYAYWNDFETSCISGSSYKVDGDPMDESKYWKITYITNDGTSENRYYSKKNGGASWDSSIVGSSGAHTCSDIVAKLNNPDYYGAVQKVIETTLGIALKEAEEAARERSKERCKALALYASVDFDGDGNIINKVGFGEEPSAAYYYLKAKKIVDDPDAARVDIVKQLRESLVANNPGLSDDEIDAKIDEQKSQIDDTLDALLTRAQTIYDKFDKVLTGAGTGTGDGNPETSYWYEKSNGEIVCTEFDSFDDTITNESGYQDILDSLLSGATTSTNPQPTTPTGNIDECQSTAGSLGWILCPVLRIMSENVDRIYDDFVQKQFLEIDATSLDPNDPSGQRVYAAWGAIRNIANVMFVILFMIVVFSQLTSFGLTNYGIKKMLPKLIIIAVLVNISFLLCQFAVDLSNVLGYTMNNLFDSLGGTVSGLGGSFNSSSTAVNWITTLGFAIAASTAGSWLPVFLLTLLSAAISVFFGALVLGARKAGIYILIVLAPAAIVCYALPNAKKMFDRWFKIFTALLVVFPICGALMGGGNFASYILLGSGGFFLTLVAMLLRVVPFFLIPGLVRSAMSAMGNVGAKISSIGSRLGGTATGSLRKSDGFQRFSEFGEQLRGRGISLRHKALGKLTGGKYTGSRGSKRRLAKSIGLQEARIRGDAKAAAIAAGGFISSGRRDDIMSSAIDTEETQGIKDAENGYKLSMDTGNCGAVNNELEKRLNELQENPDNIEVRRKVKALTKILLESDDGRGALMGTVREFAEKNQGSEATNILGKYLGNGENMGKIKGSDQRGLQKLVMDINNGAGIKSALEYGALGTDKLKAGTVGNIDVSALKQQVAAAKAGILSGDKLTQVTDIYRQALASENAANLINGESLEQINKLFKEEYKALNGSYDGFQEARLGGSSSDSGTIQVQGADNGAGNIVSTGNDARPTIDLNGSFEDAREVQRQRNEENRNRQRPIN